MKMEPRTRAPEGGWGWMVVLGSCISHLLMGAVVRSMGVIYLLLQERYDTSATMTAWFTAVPLLLWTGLGPVTTALCDRFSCRSVTVVGGLLLGVGLVSAAFVTDVILVFLTFGILTGIGLCFIYVPGYLIVGEYFDDKKGVAMALSTVGSGVGAFLFPFLIQMMYDYYGYRGCFIILGAITFNGCVGGALFRPLKNNRCKSKGVCKNPTEDKSAIENGNCSKMPIYNGQLRPADICSSPSSDKCDQTCPTQNSVQKRTDRHKGSGHRYEIVIDFCNSNYEDNNDKKMNNGKSGLQSRTRHPSRSVENVPLTVNGYTNSKLDITNNYCDAQNKMSHKRTWRSENELENLNNNVSPFKGVSTEMLNSLNRLTGSRNGAYTLLEAVDAEPPCDKDTQQETGKKTRRKLFNWELLKLPSFLVICLLGITANATFAITVNFLPALAVDMGMTRDQGAFLLSMLGIGDMIGRLPVGILFDLPLVKTHRNMIYGLFMTVNGLMTFVMPLSRNYSTMSAVCLIRGLSSGVFMSQRATILADMIGISRVASAFGMQLLAMTLGSLGARMTGGMLKDSIGVYDPIFYSTGLILVVSTFVFCGYIYCDNRRTSECVSEVQVE